MTDRDRVSSRVSPIHGASRKTGASANEDMERAETAWFGASVPHLPGGGSAVTWTEARDAASDPEPVTGPSRYQRIALLGEGGMGTVWLGHDRVLDRRVAIKIPGQDLRRIRLLEREARIAARLDHPGIVAIFDMAEIDGWPCFVMPHIEGSPLAELVIAGEIARRPMTERVQLVADAADAIASAHRQGIVHHDLSPMNLLVDREGRTRVIDWGLALFTDGGSPPPDGVRGGTPGYTPPEVAQAGPPTPAVDVWSLGAILAMLASIPPPDGGVEATAPDGPNTAGAPPSASTTLRSVALLGARGAGGPAVPPPPDLPVGLALRYPDLDRIVRTCLHHSPSARYPDARALHDALKGWLGQQAPLPAAPPDRSRLLPALLGALGIVLLAAAVTAFLTATPYPAGSDEAAIPASSDEAEHTSVRVAEQLLVNGASHEALSLAVDALRPGADRVAGRGLAFHALAQPSSRARLTPFPKPCEGAVPDADGVHVVCQDGFRVQLLVDGIPAWTRFLDPRDARVTADHVLVVTGSRKLLVLDRTDGGLVHVDPRPGSFAGRGTTWRLSPDRLQLLPPPGGPDAALPPGPTAVQPPPWPVPCASGAITAQDVQGRLLVGCAEGGAWWLGPDGAAEPIPHERRVRFEALGSTPGPDGHRPVGGTRDGRVVVLDGSGDTIQLGEPVIDLRPGDENGEVIVHGGRGALRWVDLERSAVLRDPGQHRGHLSAARGRVALAHTDGLRVWTMGAGTSRRLLRTRHGLSDVAISPSGDAVATNGAGYLTGMHLPTGLALRPVRWGAGVGMSIAWDDRAEHFWVFGAGSGGPFPVRVVDGMLTLGGLRDVPGDYRQVLPLTDGRLALVGYRQGVLVVGRANGPAELWSLHPEADRDADVTHAARSLCAQWNAWAADSGLWLQHDAAPPRRVASGGGWTALTVDPDGRITAAAEKRLLVVDRRGDTIADIEVSAPVSSLVALPALEWIAAGDLDGSVTLRDADSLAPVAAWRLHRDRVSSLSVSPDGSFLASVAWDGVLRVLPLDIAHAWKLGGDAMLREALHARLAEGEQAPGQP